MTRASGGPYCLRCFAPLVKGKSLCGACGFVSTPSQRRRYWNLAPGIRRTQAALQVLTALVLLPPSSFVRGFGFAAAFTWIAVHYTWSTLTSRSPYFRPRLFWVAYFLLAAGILATGPGRIPPLPEASVVALAMAAVSLWIAHRFSRWKHSRVEAGARRVPDPAAALEAWMATPHESAFEPHRTYCLRCFATIEDDHARCEACGHVSRGLERERYWNVSPGLLLVSRALTLLFLLAGPTLFALCSVGLVPRRLEELLYGLAVLTLMLALPACWTVGHLVRRRPEVDMTSFWAALFLATAAALAAFSIRAAAIAATAAVVVLMVGRMAGRWKARLTDVRPVEVARLPAA